MWVPCLLTVDQKRQHVVDSERCLELFRRNKPNFLRRCVTMDETWIYHYTPESKRSSAKWSAVGEKRPKPVCRPQKNFPRKEILLERGSHHRNERLLRGQR